MSASTFEQVCQDEKNVVERRCADLIELLASELPATTESISYSLLGGGKRLRPILCLWAHDMVGGSHRDAATDAACAIECVHTYSLIHDDLPCMDDDDIRRGKPSSHKKFGEATAVLTGDALLTLSFLILSTIPDRRDIGRIEHIVEATRVLAASAGTAGLIAGQILDLAHTADSGDLDTVVRIHQNKTARLIAAAMEIGAVLGGANSDTRVKIRRGGTLAGEAFQIIDDLLDLASDKETLGKTPGKDVLKRKLTYPSLVGVSTARQRARALIRESKSVMPARNNAPWIDKMMDFIVERAT